jgi:glutamate carboxypeptidase
MRQILWHNKPMSRTSPDETAILNRIHAAQAAMAEQVMVWSAINSGSFHTAGLARMATALTQKLAALPGDVRLVPAMPVRSINESGEESQIRHSDNIHLAVRASAPIQILLTGHMDTVFGARHAFQTPAWRDAKTIHGPGTADMKGGLTVMIAALEALEASPWASRIGYQIVINSDEEVSSLGSAALLENAAKQAHIGLVFEPAMADGTLAGARKGIGNFTVVARGKSAHAGRNPQDGRNAILAVADMLLRAAALAQGGISINAAKIDGGGPTNVVPDLAVGRFEVRTNTHGERASIEGELRRLANMIAAERDIKLELHGRFHRPPKPMDSIQAGLFAAVKACGADLDIPIGWTATGGCCDGNNLAATGLPVVDTLGVRGGEIHSSNEYMIAESLTERAQLVALLLMRLASGAMPLPARGQISTAGFDA